MKFNDKDKENTFNTLKKEYDEQNESTAISQSILNCTGRQLTGEMGHSQK